MAEPVTARHVLLTCLEVLETLAPTSKFLLRFRRRGKPFFKKSGNFFSAPPAPGVLSSSRHLAVRVVIAIDPTDIV
jgi:hypothetical protein